MPYQQGPYQQGSHPQGPYGQPPVPHTPPKKSRKGLIIALSAVGVLVLVVIVAVVAIGVLTKDKVVATDLAVGDCITELPGSDLVRLVPTIACDQLHAGEVYAVLTIPGDAYPGSSTITEWQNKCPAELESYAPDASAGGTISVFVLYPTEQTWADGDHAVTCIATTDEKQTGSLRG